MKLFAAAHASPFSLSGQMAAISILAILMWMTGLPYWISQAQAAALYDFSDTLSDSDLSASSNHTISFGTPNGVSAGQTFTITFQAGFVVPVGFDFNDVDFATTTEALLGSSASGATWGVSTTTTSVTFTSGTGVIASSSVVTLQFGTHATTGTTGNTQITNPGSSASYTVTATLPQDSAVTRVYIINDVVVTASVNSTFTFTILGTTTAIGVNGTSTNITTTSETIPFGTLTPGEIKTGMQEVGVTTNAANGFSVTVIQDQNLISSSGADINLFIDGATTTVPVAWQSPANTFNVPQTYGHYGITSSDDTTSSSTAPGEWGNNLWAGNIDVPREVLYHSAPSSGWSAAEGQGWARVGYQIEIGSLQEAATDYTNTMTYVATPVF